MLKKIALQNFRSYDKREFVFSPTVTVITGKNGTGKTNLLEAIHTLYTGKSFRDSDEQLLRYTTDWWKITGVLGGVERELRYQPKQNSKHLFIDGADKGRFTYRQQLPVVLFEPEHLMLIHGSPSLRRVYLDNLLIQLVPTYRATLAKYERALLQRNNLLKRGGPLNTLRDAIFVWDIALTEHGTALQKARRELVETLNVRLGDEYSALATKTHTVIMNYEQSGEASVHELATHLSRSLEKDVLRGFTSVGPHRDDIEFFLDGKNAKTTASRGEVRTIVLALKYLELELLSENYSTPPLFLLDDVFSELDEERQAALITNTNSIQKIITTTHTPQVSGMVKIKLSV